MAVPGYKARLLIGDFNLAAQARDISAPWSQEMLDETVFTTAPAKSFVPGQDTATLSVSGLYSTAEHADLASFKSASAQAITFAPSGMSVSSELWMVNAILTEFTTGAQVADLVQFDLGCQADGIVDFGYSLHDLGAETGDGNGTSLDGAAASSNGGVAHLHVTAYSGFTNVVFTIADSANNTDFSTIGTFATVSGLTQERLVIAGTIRRYVRVSYDVTGSGSVTFQAGFARR